MNQDNNSLIPTCMKARWKNEKKKKKVEKNEHYFVYWILKQDPSWRALFFVLHVGQNMFEEG